MSTKFVGLCVARRLRAAVAVIIALLCTAGLLQLCYARQQRLRNDLDSSTPNAGQWASQHHADRDRRLGLDTDSPQDCVDTAPAVVQQAVLHFQESVGVAIANCIDLMHIGLCGHEMVRKGATADCSLFF